MRAIRGLPPERSRLALTAVISVVTLAALIVLGMVLAYWTWEWFAPRPEPRAPMVERAVLTASAHTLFGGVRRHAGPATATAGAIRLLGVVAAEAGSQGFAVMQLESREIRAVREGEEVAPGIRLVEVHPDHVMLLRNGIRESLAWPLKDAGKKP